MLGNLKCSLTRFSFFAVNIWQVVCQLVVGLFLCVFIFCVFRIFMDLLFIIFLGVFRSSTQLYSPLTPCKNKNKTKLLQLPPSLPFVYSIFMEMQNKTNGCVCLL